MDGVYGFIKKKAKENGIKIENLHKKCGTSRTTMYRLMKGFAIPSIETEQLLANALRLTNAEKAELHYYYKLSETNPTLFEAHLTLENILLKTTEEVVPKIDIIFYEDKKFIMTYKELLENILKVSDDPHFSCNIKIMNSTDAMFTNPICDFLDELKQINPDKQLEDYVEIDHLIRFMEKDSHGNILTLKSILKLFRYNCYNVHFDNIEDNTDGKSEYIYSTKNAFNDFILIKYIDNSKPKYMFLSLLEGSYSDCYSFEDKMLYEFFSKVYDDKEKEYQQALIKARNFDFYSNMLYEIEINNDLWMFKPNMCYNMVPPELMRAITGRMPKENINALLTDLGESPNNLKKVEEMVNYSVNFLDLRYKATFVNKHVDIYSQEGLVDFASTGKLSDHIPYLTEFSKEERRIILENVKNRNNDPKDPFRCYILNTAGNQDMDVIINSSNGIFIECFEKKVPGKKFGKSDVYLEQGTLSRILIDFAENHVPTRLALSSEDANNFFENLIATHCQ